MIRRFLTAGLAAVAIAATPVAAADDTNAPAETNIRGWLELARVKPGNLLLRAKLDTGAKTSAIHAEILAASGSDEFPDRATLGDNGLEIDDSDVEAGDDSASKKKKTPDTVVFRLETRKGKTAVYEREIVRWVTVKKKEGGTVTRPVVRMRFCISGLPVEGEVGLTDRDHFNYPLLIGRTMLKDAHMAVDPAKTFTHKSNCYKGGPRPNLD